MSEVEVLARVERRRKWTQAEKAALLAEVDAAGGKVLPVARRHGISESVLYNWRCARKAALEASSAGSSGAITFLPVGVIGEATNETPAMMPSMASPRPPLGVESRAGAIEIALPDGSWVCVDASVDEAALSRVMRAIRGSR